MLSIRQLAKSATQRAARTLTQEPRRSVHNTNVLRAGIPVTVDGKDIEVPAGSTVLQACEAAGVYIPRFCYHDRLSIAGNCRMCLVEIEKGPPKPAASCAMPVAPKMRIKTDSPMVKKAREGVIEFLLANHPLDCPICDQGGECDLQDLSYDYGSELSRFREVKRTVEDKNLGPLVKTVMTRCIHCTRCVRFSAEVAGVPVLGTTGRGNGMEIGTYVGKFFDSEMSGNVVDLCPVGALTSKPSAFTARPWDLNHTETVDVMDAMGCNIRVDTRGAEVMRILPRLNEEINEEWISDKTRYAYDGLKRQRLDIPMIRQGDEFVPATWQDAFALIKQKVAGVKGYEMLAIAGDHADAESMIVLKDLFNKLGASNLQHSQYDAPLNADVRSSYLFNSRIAGIEDADLVLLVDSNPRMEAPILAARLRKCVRHYGLNVASVGPQADLAFAHQNLGNNTQILNDIASGKHSFSKAFKAAKRPLVIVGMGALSKGEGLQAAVHNLKNVNPNLMTPEWNGVNFLHTAASRVAALDIGFVPGPNARVSTPAKFVYLLQADKFDDSKIASDAFVVYQGSHGDEGASRADVVLPGAAYTEKAATYVNMEGRMQRTIPAVGMVGQAREDWKILRALSELLGRTLPYNSLDQVRSRLTEVAPHLAKVEVVEPSTYQGVQPSGSLESSTFQPYVQNFFQTDAISRASKTMAKCSAQLPTARNSYTQASQ